MRAARGFNPGSDQRGVSNAYSGADAADLLLTSAAPSSEVASGEGILLLADGSRYSGTLFGADVVGVGELVFTTGMTGFQGPDLHMAAARELRCCSRHLGIGGRMASRSRLSRMDRPS